MAKIYDFLYPRWDYVMFLDMDSPGKYKGVADCFDPITEDELFSGSKGAEFYMVAPLNMNRKWAFERVRFLGVRECTDYFEITFQAGEKINEVRSLDALFYRLSKPQELEHLVRKYDAGMVR